MSIRLLVTGGRDYADRDEVRRVLSSLPPGSTVILDACPPRRLPDGRIGSADWHAAGIARGLGLCVEEFPAAWTIHAPGWCRCRRLPRRCRPMAGPRRNQRQVDEGKPNHFYDFPGNSGTADMVRRCEAAGLPRWKEAV